MSIQPTSAFRPRWMIGAASAALACALLSVPAHAQTAPANDDVDEIITTGIRASLDDALNVKRNADTILDGISADDLGNFPDLNLGEALQRIPGVQINREAERRDASISVRGLPGSFAKTTLNGQNISNPNFTAGNPFGVFDSAVFSGVDIVKSFSAESLSGGLAANVDLKLNSALERPDGVYIVRAKGEYEELTEKLNPALFASGSKHFAEGRFGVFGAVAWSQQNFRRDSINITRYNDETFAGITDDTFGENVDSNRRDLYVGDIRQFVQVSEGDRISASAGFDFDLTENFNFQVNGIYAERNLDKATTDILQIQPRLSAAQVTSPGEGTLIGTFDYDQGADGLEDVYLHQTINFDDPQVVFGNRDRPFFAETLAIYPEFNFETGPLRFNVTGTYSESEFSSIQNQYDARIVQNGNSLATNGSSGVTGVLDIGNEDLLDLDFTLDFPTDPDGGNPLFPLQLGGGGYALTSSTGLSAQRFQDGQRSQFTVAGFARGVTRDLVAIDGSVAYDLENLGPFVEISAGARYEEETADRYNFENSGIGLDFNTLTNDVIVPNTGISSGADFFNGNAPGFLRDGFLSINRELAAELLLPVIPGLEVPTSLNGGNGNLGRRRVIPQIPNPFTPFNQRLSNVRNGSDDLSGASLGQNFVSQRDNTEVFGMVSFDFDENYDSFPVRGNLGLRYIKTDLSGLAFGADEEGQGSYEEILPSFNVIANVTDDFVVQGAVYETFEAFNLAEFNPSNTIVDIAPGNELAEDPTLAAGRIRIDQTALQLEPRSSLAFDAGVAWYNRPGSIIGATLFHKEIRELRDVDNCAANIDAFIADNPEVGGVISGGTTFTDDRGDCRIRLAANPTTGTFANPRFDLNRLENTEPFTVTGVEFQISQNTDFLDGFWGNFGGTFNYTWVDVDEAEENGLTQVSEETYNLIGYYETDAFSIRLAQNFRSDYALTGGGTFFGAARRVKDRGQLDLSATYNPFENTQLRFQAFNLTDSERAEFQVVEALSRRVDTDGRTFTFSIQQKF